jgi:hypothetical protein
MSHGFSVGARVLPTSSPGRADGLELEFGPGQTGLGMLGGLPFEIGSDDGTTYEDSPPALDTFPLSDPEPHAEVRTAASEASARTRTRMVCL